MAFANKQSSLAGGSESSPLATKLQQAWLQSRLPKVQSSNPHPPFSVVVDAEARALDQTSREPPWIPTTTSLTKTTAPSTAAQTALLSHLHKSSGAPILHSFSPNDAILNNHRSFISDDPTSVGDSSSEETESLAFLDEMLMEEEDTITEQSFMYEEGMGYNAMQVTFLDQMLMEEDMNGNKPCPYQESTAYQAVEKGFADLINQGSPSTSSRSSHSFENTREEVTRGAQTEYNNVAQNQSLNFNQMSDKFYEEDVLHDYTDILCKHLNNLSMEASIHSSSNSNNNANDMKVCVPEATIYNKPQEHISKWLGMNLPQGTGTGVVQHNAKFTFQTGDEHQLINLLTICAEAVKQNDVRKASTIIAELHDLTSPSGSGAQRMAHYVTDALVAKMSGTGAQLSAALKNNAPSPTALLRAYKMIVLHQPYLTLAHFSTNVAILNAFKGATRVHLVDYGIGYGSAWLSLIRELGCRNTSGGAPNLRITGIERSCEPGGKPSNCMIRCCERLTEYAKSCNVPFQFTAIADKWENVTATQLALRPDEVLAINCCYKLSSLLDESVMVANPRQMLLNKIRSMNPKVFVTVFANASCNEPFFMSRVRETIKYYSILFDTADVAMPPDLKERFFMEKEVYGQEILNIIACEGLERYERNESYKQWHSRLQRAGFIQQPLQLSETNTIKSILGRYDKRFGIGQDGGWFLVGWKNEVVNALSIWSTTH